MHPQEQRVSADGVRRRYVGIGIKWSRQIADFFAVLEAGEAFERLLEANPRPRAVFPGGVAGLSRAETAEVKINQPHLGGHPEPSDPPQLEPPVEIYPQEVARVRLDKVQHPAHLGSSSQFEGSQKKASFLLLRWAGDFLQTRGMIVDELVALLRGAFADFADARTGKNTTCRVSDAAAAAFSVFFTQSASFLAWQRTLCQTRGGDNARALFGVEKLPGDNQIRNPLDPVSEQALQPVFGQALELLRASGRLEGWRGLGGGFLIALDGSEYFRSTKICRPGCPRRASSREGVTSFVHALVSPALVSPGRDAVLVLEPEFITNSDGRAKQDCEQAAARRWLERAPARWKGSTLLGDDLYCHQPFCEMAREYGLHFLFVCKPASHPALHEELAGLGRLGAVQTLRVTRWNGRARETDTYRFAQRGCPCAGARTRWRSTSWKSPPRPRTARCSTATPLPPTTPSTGQA